MRKSMAYVAAVFGALAFFCTGCASLEETYTCHYHFTFGNTDAVADKKRVFDLLKPFLLDRGFMYRGEGYCFFLDKPISAYSDEQLRKEPWFQDFSFAHRKFNAACHYIPQKNLVVFYERIYSASRRKKFLETVEGLKKELRGNGFKFKYESNAIKNTLFWGNGNLRFMPFQNVPPTRGARYQVENYQ